MKAVFVILSDYITYFCYVEYFFPVEENISRHFPIIKEVV